MKYFIYFPILLFIYLKIIYVNAIFKELEVTIFDHHPLFNPDFEFPLQHGELTTGLVSPLLVNRSRPSFIGKPLQGCIHNTTTFDTWFVSSPGINIPINTKLKLRQSEYDESRWVFTDNEFFPIDDQGWDAIKLPNGSYKYQRYTDKWSELSGDPYRVGKYHNFHFCMHASATFDFKGTEVFSFQGDDDVWVYVNGKLVIDLGGIHQIANASVDFANANIGISKGDRCRFDFFYCERHTDQSEIRIETELELYCSYKDYCGACQGTGSTCCDAVRDCNDNNPCTIDECPTDYTSEVLKNGNWRNYCTHKPIPCEPKNICEIAKCSNDTNGICMREPLVCPPRACKTARCSTEFGCQYEEKSCGSSDQCIINKCQNDTCVQLKTDCDDKNPCTIDSCDPIAGCLHIYKDCDDNNPCTLDSCGTSDGKCINALINHCTNCSCPSATKCDNYNCMSDGSCIVTPKSISDSNLCTTEKCNSATGEITFQPIQCNSTTDLCMTASCDQSTGKCITKPISCDDGNECTSDSCEAGKCIHTPKSCDDNDSCTVDTCSDGKCIHTAKVCTTNDRCLEAFCSDNQCQTRPINCNVPSSYCRVSVCDSQAGCLEVPRSCIPDDPACQKGTCSEEKRRCEFRSYDPLPFKCQSIAVKAGVAIGAAAIAGIVIGGAAAITLSVYAGKKGYDYWKNHKTAIISSSNQNPLYESKANGSGVNPLYTG